MAVSFNVGDLVWAKMKGFSPWPGKVSNPMPEMKKPSSKKNMSCIFFFGTDNYAWIADDGIKPYEEFKDQFMKNQKSGAFKDAIKAVESHKSGDDVESDASSDLDEPSPIFSSISHKFKQQDYTRQPFLSKSKKKQEQETTFLNSTSSAIKTTPAKESAKKPRKSSTSTTESNSVKRKLTMDSTEASPSEKRPRPIKQNKSVITPTKSLSSQKISSAPSTSSTSSTVNHHSSPSRQLLMRSYISRPVTPPLDVERVSDTLKQKNVKASSLKFGFLGIGIMGSGMVKNLINSGHNVTIWNRTPSKCSDFVKAGAVKGQTPADVIAASDITFSCVADPQAAKDMVFGNCGVLQEVMTGKGYVEMTSIDMETSQDICEAISARGGRYLESPVSGSKTSAEEGTLILMCSGDKSLFDDCSTCFNAMGEHAFYLGDVGNASKMNLIMNLILGTSMAGLAEGMALADRAGLLQKDLLEILQQSSLSCPIFMEKGKAIIDGSFSTSCPLQHLQKDLRLVLSLGDQMEQPLPLTASANEVFKHAKRLGYGEHDMSAVYIRARF